MKSKKALWACSLFALLPVMMALASPGALACGKMYLVPLDRQHTYHADAFACPEIVDVWTTNDPFGDPFTRVNDFTIGSDILALVTLYYHCGGLIPRQYARAYTCDPEEQALKTCRYDWSIGPLPEGLYLLINYYDPVEFPPGNYDFAVKVGDLVYGYPDPSEVPPDCFALHE